MKLKLHYLLSLSLVLLLTIKTAAQTTLAPGDIVVIQLQGDDPDSFAFVTFVDIDAGTGIYFTDCGVTTGGQFRSPACTEGARKYTAPAGGLNAGAIIKYSGGGVDFTNYSDSRITGTNFLLSTGGDQVVVFQDLSSATGGTEAATNPSFIYILSSASTLFAGDPNDSNETSLPSTLSSPTSALALGANTGADNEFDNVIYNGTYDFSGFATTTLALAAAKAAFEDTNNYLQVQILDAAHSSAVAAMPSSLNINTLTLSDEFLSNSFAVYPNPSNGNITIINSGITLQNVIITDMNGRIVYSNEMNGVTSNVDLRLSLTTGIYLMKLTSNDASATKKLIIK